MKVIAILNQISRKENKVNYTDIPLDKWLKYQKSSIRQHVEFVEDDDFDKFYEFLNNSLFPTKIYRPTAVKILNNGYYI